VRYRAVSFDIGETLLHVPEPAPTYREILARCGCLMPLSEVQAMLKEVRRTVDERIPDWVTDDFVLNSDATTRRRALHVETLLSLAGVGHSPERQATFFDIYVGTQFFTLYPDVLDTLRDLRAVGCRLGIISNWESRLLQLCAAHGIADYFDFAVVSELEGFVKPHPRMYQRALELAGVSPDRVAHAGGSLRDDIQGAAAVGIRGVLVDRAGEHDTGYEPCIRSLSDLRRVLDAA